jgi:hypothetical protein
MASHGYYTEEVHGPLDPDKYFFNLREQDTAAIDQIYTEALAS